MNWKTFGPKLHKAGAYLTGLSGGGMFATSGDAYSWQFYAASGATGFGALCIITGDLISMFAADDNDGPSRTPPPFTVCFLFFVALAMLSGCQSSVAIGESNAAVTTAVKGAQGSVAKLADYIANEWAGQETARVKTAFCKSKASHTVSATVAGLPGPGAPAVVQVIDEPTRDAEQAIYDRQIGLIALWKPQVRDAVIAQSGGDFATAQALLQGQQNYYQSANQGASTLTSSVNGIVSLFQQFAPAISAAIAPAKK